MIQILFVLLLASTAANSQINAKLMRYMDASDTHITFVYGGDIWVVEKDGGQAVQLTESPGEESYPRFSPDGSEIAYTARYNGNADVYVVPARGGMARRITYASYYDRMVEWHPDGQKILFASRRETGIPRVNQFFYIDRTGGMPEKLPVPYGELASFSPGGDKMAYVTKITETFPFKRYRGGLTSDIILFDLETKETERITDHPAPDGKPAWLDNTIYYISDRGREMRRNIWAYDLESKESRQITYFEDFDITYLSAGSDDLVFEMGGKLYTMPAGSSEYEEVKVHVASDLSTEMPRLENVSDRINNVAASPKGKRVVFEARGELFNVPVKEGYTINMTRSSGAFDHSPAWSPDGQYVAYWSDASGEYQIHLKDLQSNNEARKLTSRDQGYGYRLFWSPDSKKLAFIDEKNMIYVVDAESGEKEEAGHSTWNIGHGGRQYFPISWSPDSRWIAYSLGQDNANNALFMYSLDEKKVHQVTSGYYSDVNPVFSVDGKHLFFLTDREFQPVYSGLGDGTWTYPNNTHLAALSLTKEGPHLLKPKNDEIGKEEGKEGKDEEKEGAQGPSGNNEKDNNNDKNDKNDESPNDQAAAPVEVDWEGLSSRVTVLPPQPGNLRNMMAFKKNVVYVRAPLAGDRDDKPSLMLYDMEERKEETVIDNLQEVEKTADGKALVVKSAGKYGIIKAAPGQKIEEPIPTGDLVMRLVPKKEWKQIFHDTWRRHRDFFYDEDMHQVRWDTLRQRYGSLLEDARTRWDVTNLQSNLAAELSAGHTYTFGGDQEEVDRIQTGYLGIDWAMKNGRFRIKEIIRPADWDTQVRSPLDQPGSEIEEGDYIMAVNGIPLDTDEEPYAAFDGMAGKTVSLSISKSGAMEDAGDHVVKLLSQQEEQELRYLAWMEKNRQQVDSLSDGKLGYIYMSNTSMQGQRELVRMFYGQLDKQGFVIDERWNGGGQLADRFLELLQRPVVYNLYWRHGRHHTHPIKTNTGPMAMLINGWAGSGGDGLPWAFQELEAGPVIGQRTIGILVGPATGHRLIDGGGITVPGARLYDNDGHWFWEGEGVTPDIPVWDDPNMLIRDRDPQLERAVKEVMDMLEENPPKTTPPPAMEDRTAKGLKNK